MRTKDELVAVAKASAPNAAAPPAALDYIEQNSLPGTKTEAWLKTNLRPLLQQQYSPAKAATLTDAQLAEYQIEGLEANRLVFVNGFYVAELSQIISPDKELVVLSRTEAKTQYADLLAKIDAKPENSVFTAINTAYAADGVFVCIPRGKTLSHPLHIIHVADTAEASLMQERNLIVLEENAHAKVIESYMATNEQANFTNVALRIVLGQAASLDYNLFQRQSHAAYLLHDTQVWQERDSRLLANAITLQGALVRNSLSVTHEGKGVETDLNGLYLVDGNQHVDNHLYVNHAQPHCNSNQFYRGIIDNEASAVFTGKVYVAQDSQQTNANQSNKNILLTDTAKVSSKPQLEIYADDVACSHGSSTGQLDADAMFYMVQRGLSKHDAKVFLLFAFVADVVNKISIEALRNYVDTFVARRLRGN